MPTMNAVLNLYSGDYYSEIGVSFMLKQKQIGVIDVDNDENLGGGQAADITANSVFKLLCMMLDCRRIIGILAAERCSSGSVVRFRVNTDIPDLPEPSRDIEWPDGKPGLSPKYAKEIHNSRLMSFRTTHLMGKLHFQGGWFLAECPSMRGDKESATMFDPTFDMHSSVQRGSYWTTLKNETGAIIVSANMCPLKELYPPKASDFMISSNLIASLGIKLASLACPHPLGTHDGRFSKLPEMLKHSQTWLPELCRIIVDGISELCPKGGKSMRMGVDAVGEWAMEELKTRDLGRWIRQEEMNIHLGAIRPEHNSVLVLESLQATASGIHFEDLEITQTPPWRGYQEGIDYPPLEDIDPRMEEAVYFMYFKDGATQLEQTTLNATVRANFVAL